MDYTTSNANVTHGGTGNRMHQDTAPVTTAVTAKDLNQVMWSLMKVLEAASVAPAAFDPGTPATYDRLLTAINALVASGGGVQSSFTPGLTFGGGSTGITYALQQGYAFTTGKLVTYHAFVQLTSKGSSTGNAKVSLGSLPNAVANFPCQASVDQMASLANHPSGMLIASSNLVEVRTFDGAGSEAALATHANFTNTTQLYLSGSYIKP